MITKEQIAEVRKLAYASYDERCKLVESGERAFASGYGKSGNLTLNLQEVSTRTRGRKALRDTYKVDGKVVAKADILKILPA